MEAGIVKWPLSVIRLRGKDTERIIDLADHILGKWRSYTDEEAFIFAETDGTPHNTITPIARMKDGMYELDLTLRNNITTEEHPLGVYHPHAKLHHIKKENIGLIEVMGLAVLPARLKGEMELLKEYILEGKDIRSNEQIEKHGATNRSRNTRTGWTSSFRPIRRSTQTTLITSWNRKSEKSSARYSKMQASTSTTKKDSGHSTGSSMYYNPLINTARAGTLSFRPGLLQDQFSSF